MQMRFNSEDLHLHYYFKMPDYIYRFFMTGLYLSYLIDLTKRTANNKIIK